MKLYESRRMRNMFLNVIEELRNETNHQKTFIESWQIQNLKWIWRMAHNRAEAKGWMRMELGW